MSSEEQAGQEAALVSEAACKICRGRGEEFIFSDSTPYIAHIRQEHPESLPPAE